MSLQPTRFQALSLYRQLIRSANKFNDYNIKSYAQRRIRNGFIENYKVNTEIATQQYEWGLTQLAMVQRQSMISQMYPEMESVLNK